MHGTPGWSADRNEPSHWDVRSQRAALLRRQQNESTKYNLLDHLRLSRLFYYQKMPLFCLNEDAEEEWKIHCLPFLVVLLT